MQQINHRDHQRVRNVPGDGPKSCLSTFLPWSAGISAPAPAGFFPFAEGVPHSPVGRFLELLEAVPVLLWGESFSRRSGWGNFRFWWAMNPWLFPHWSKLTVEMEGSE